jgi:NitT/TauT family transport system substrate-binding protein
MMQSRRRFLATASLAGAAGLLGTQGSLHAEPPPETTSVRLLKLVPVTCIAPVYVAGELLRAEGFTDVRYVGEGTGSSSSDWMTHGELDFDINFPPALIVSIDSGLPIKVLAGVHPGCFELFATESVQSITDLKGKKVGVHDLYSTPHMLVILMAAYVGLDPFKDIQWVESHNPIQLFIDRIIDAFPAIPPESQELRDRKVGHTIVSSTLDRPWSQYYCCMLAGATDYVEKYPAATKRVVRAFLKAADICVSDPKMVAQQLVDGGFTKRYDYALRTLTELRYDVWREFDPDDSLRFYALRMREASLIKLSPQEIIAVDQLRRTPADALAGSTHCGRLDRRLLRGTQERSEGGRADVCR